MITTLTPRENRILALQTGSFSTKAGLIDHLTVPIVSISSQVGIKLRKSRADEDGGDGSTRAASPNGGEPELDIMMQDPPAPEAGPTGDAPSAQVDPSSVDDASPEGLKALDAHPNILKNGNAYIAGAKLSAERTLETPAERPDIIRPIKQGLPVDWPALAGLWQHLLLRELPFAINRSRNDWSLLLTVPVSWGRDDHARATKIMFEDLNMLAFTIIEQPLVTLYGCNMTTGLVIDIGHETTDVTPILDNSIIRHAHKSIAVGGRDIEKHLARLLREDPTFMKQLGDEELTEAMVRTVKEAVCEVNVNPRSKTGLSETNDAKRVSVTVDGKQYTVGSARYRCTDVLFDPSIALTDGEDTYRTSLSIPEACYLAVTEACEPERRTGLWDALVLSGGSSAFKGIRHRLDKEIMRLIAASETSNEFQAKEIKWASMPDYFTAYKESPEDLTYLGASIVARVIFTGSSFPYITKADYNELGPASIYLKQ